MGARPLALAVVGLVVAIPLGAQAGDQGEAIGKFYREWSQATVERGPQGYASFFADSARLLPPNELPVIGRPAIRAWLERTQASSPYTARPERITQDEIRIEGSWAFVRTTLQGKRVPKAGGGSIEFDAKYFDVLHRGADGRWEFAYRMWSSNLAEPKG